MWNSYPLGRIAFVFHLHQHECFMTFFKYLWRSEVMRTFCSDSQNFALGFSSCLFIFHDGKEFKQELNETKRKQNVKMNPWCNSISSRTELFHMFFCSPASLGTDLMFIRCNTTHHFCAAAGSATPISPTFSDIPWENWGESRGFTSFLISFSSIQLTILPYYPLDFAFSVRL